MSNRIIPTADVPQDIRTCLDKFLLSNDVMAKEYARLKGLKEGEDPELFFEEGRSIFVDNFDATGIKDYNRALSLDEFSALFISPYVYGVEPEKESKAGVRDYNRVLGEAVGTSAMPSISTSKGK